MTHIMKSFVKGMLMSLQNYSKADSSAESYVFDAGSGTLTIYKDDGSLSYSFSDESLRLTVLEV